MLTRANPVAAHRTQQREVLAPIHRSPVDELGPALHPRVATAHGEVEPGLVEEHQSLERNPANLQRKVRALERDVRPLTLQWPSALFFTTYPYRVSARLVLETWYPLHEPRLLQWSSRCQAEWVTIGTRSARSRLLRRGRRDGERTQLSLELGGVEAGPGCQPVAGAQLEEALARPVGQDAEEVAEVGLGIEVVKAGRGDQRHQVAGGLRVVVAADEEPRLATDRESPFILPMLANAPPSTTGGTLRSAQRSASRIANIAAAKTSPCSTRATELARCCRPGCWMPASARR